MQQIRHKNTRPEMRIRQLVSAMGYRYRLHVKNLPGKPDLVFRRRKAIILVHGCFWHQHGACREGRIPNTRQDYWIPKLAKNVARDKAHLLELEKAGWRVLTIWECELEHPDLQSRIERFLDQQDRSIPPLSTASSRQTEAL